MNLLFFDSETTGKADFRSPAEAFHQPHLVQLGALLTDGDGLERGSLDVIIKPDGWDIPEEASSIHGITTEIASAFGIPLVSALSVFSNMLANADMLIAHNIDFDVLIMMAAFSRMSEKFAQAVAGLERVRKAQTYCTMKETTNICKLPGSYGKFKWPKLTEAHQHFFGIPVEGAHDAMTDVRACKRIFFEIKKHEAGDPISF